MPNNHPLAAAIRAQTSSELLGLRAGQPTARFAEVTADDDPHEFHAYLARVMDADQNVLCVGSFYADLTGIDGNTPVVDDVLDWIGHDDFRALAQEVYGEPGIFPASVLANPGRTWSQHTITYVFDLDALAAPQS